MNYELAIAIKCALKKIVMNNSSFVVKNNRVMEANFPLAQ